MRGPNALTTIRSANARRKPICSATTQKAATSAAITSSTPTKNTLQGNCLAGSVRNHERSALHGGRGGPRVERLASTSKPDTGEVKRTSTGRQERTEQIHRTQNARNHTVRRRERRHPAARS